MVDIEIKETNTVTLLMIPGTAINIDTDEERMVIENNKKYLELK